MLNLHCNNNDKKMCDYLKANPGFIDSQSTGLSTRLRSPLQIIDEKLLYTKIVNSEKLSAVSVNNCTFIQCCSVQICSYE